MNKTMTHDDIIAYIDRQIKYAARSFSKRLMYEIYGYIRGAAESGGITSNEYIRYSNEICYNYFSSCDWARLCEENNIGEPIRGLDHKRHAFLVSKGLSN